MFLNLKKKLTWYHSDSKP